MDNIVEWGTVLGAFATFLAVLVALFMPLFERFKTQKFEKKSYYK